MAYKGDPPLEAPELEHEALSSLLGEPVKELVDLWIEGLRKHTAVVLHGLVDDELILVLPVGPPCIQSFQTSRNVSSEVIQKEVELGADFVPPLVQLGCEVHELLSRLELIALIFIYFISPAS